MFYIVKNVLYNAKLKWKKDKTKKTIAVNSKDDSRKDKENEDNSDNSDDEEGVDKWANPVPFDNYDYGLCASAAVTDTKITNDPYGATKQFKVIMYSKIEGEFFAAWEDMKKWFKD